MSTEIKKEIQLETLMSCSSTSLVTPSSRLTISAAIDELTQAVRTSEQFQNAEAGARLIKIPTGDGMALVFLQEPGRARGMRARD